MNNEQAFYQQPAVLLPGAGSMSATLSMLLKQLQPDWVITIEEKPGAAAARIASK